MRPDPIRGLRHTLSAGLAPAVLQHMNSSLWIEACATRLAELSPSMGVDVCTRRAANLFCDVGSFHPEIAAEMEYESGMFDH